MAKFKGIITPIVTPFHRDDAQSINYDATKKLIDHLIEKKVHGLFILGSNGEFHVISEQEKIEFMEFVVKYVNHRLPVYVGTGACSTLEAIRLTKAAEHCGADAVSLITPYFISPSEDELIAHFTNIANSTTLPIILYNIPKATGINLAKRVVEECAKVDNIVGIKDSSGNMDNLKDYIDAAKKYDMDVLVGSDSKILEAMKLGATGAIAGTSNVITDIVVNLYNSYVEGNVDDAIHLQEDINVLRAVLPLGTVPSIMKRSVELMGIEVGPARLPVVETTKTTDDKITEMLKHYGLVS